MNPPRSSTVRRYRYSGSSSTGTDDGGACGTLSLPRADDEVVAGTEDGVGMATGGNAGGGGCPPAALAAGFLIRVAKRSHPSGLLALVGGSSGGGGGGGRDGFARCGGGGGGGDCCLGARGTLRLLLCDDSGGCSVLPT
jgi:hypothetical protein